MLTAIRVERRLWTGELLLRAGHGELIPLAVRAEPVPGEQGQHLGYLVFASDLRARQDAEAARLRVQDVLLEARKRSREVAADAVTEQGFGEMIDAIMSTARRSLTDIAGETGTPLPSTLAGVEALTRRAAALALQLEGYTASRRNREVAET